MVVWIISVELESESPDSGSTPIQGVCHVKIYSHQRNPWSWVLECWI